MVWVKVFLKGDNFLYLSFNKHFLKLRYFNSHGDIFFLKANKKKLKKLKTKCFEKLAENFLAEKIFFKISVSDIELKNL